MGPRGARIYELSEMCVRLAASYFPNFTSCKPNAQVLGFSTDWDISVIVHCNSAQSDPNFLDTFQARCRQSESVTRWQRLVCLHATSPKSLHVFRVCTDPRGCAVLRRGSAAAPLLRLRVRIPLGEWMSVFWMLCVVRYGTLRRADHSSRGVLPGVVCLRSWHPDEETLAHQGLLHRGKKFGYVFKLISVIVFGTMLCFFTTHCSLRLIVRSEFDIPTFATRSLHACHHARAPSGGRWNCGREMSGNFA